VPTVFKSRHARHEDNRERHKASGLIIAGVRIFWAIQAKWFKAM
jgi:hypothetical protein